MQNYQDQSEMFLDLARQHNLENDCLFQNTFEMYQTLLDKLKQTEEELKTNTDITIVKHYTHGGQNIVVNPLIKAYQSLTASINQTTKVLLKIINDNAKHKTQSDDDVDNFLQALNDD